MQELDKREYERMKLAHFILLAAVSDGGKFPDWVLFTC